jgi:hypothetical protein
MAHRPDNPDLLESDVSQTVFGEKAATAGPSKVRMKSA